MIYIITGVSGSGKTTVGQLLAKHLNLPFYDADDFHPEENKLKMSKGIPLNDQDRFPWLKSIANEIPVWEHNGGGVLACSALKKSYRDILSALPDEKINWIFMSGTFDLIKKRIEERTGHFFSAELLQSQFNTLEVPGNGLHIDISATPEDIIKAILKQNK